MLIKELEKNSEKEVDNVKVEEADPKRPFHLSKYTNLTGKEKDILYFFKNKYGDEKANLFQTQAILPSIDD